MIHVSRQSLEMNAPFSFESPRLKHMWGYFGFSRHAFSSLFFMHSRSSNSMHLCFDGFCVEGRTTYALSRGLLSTREGRMKM